MKQDEFRRQLTSITPEMPERFRLRTDATLARIVKQEDADMKDTTKKALIKTGRISARTLIIAAVLIVLTVSAALAATGWHVFDIFSYMTGENPKNADTVMQRDLHSETVNGVRIDIRECGYDGKQLFLEYSFTLPGYDRPLTKEDDLYELPESFGVDWWHDTIWFNGVSMDMPGDSSEARTRGPNNGEILVTQNWRLDHEGVVLDGPMEIIWPIGKSVEPGYYRRSEHPEHWTDENHLQAPPEGCGIRFTYTPADLAASIKTEHPRVITDFDDVSIMTEEVTYSPLMTYITFKMEPNAQALAKFIEEHGEWQQDENGEPLWHYTGADVYGGWVSQMVLVDGKGNQLFPKMNGNSWYSEAWAEFDYPYIENMPDELYMAALDDTGAVDMDRTVKVK